MKRTLIFLLILILATLACSLFSLPPLHRLGLLARARLCRRKATAVDAKSSSSPDLRLPLAYGPLQAMDASAAVTISRDEIVALARQLAPNFAPDQPWQVTPNAMVQPTYATSAGMITAAQLLYGMATVYAADFAGTPVNAVTLPVTYDLLRKIGCLNTCSGTAWSFKPARIRVP